MTNDKFISIKIQWLTKWGLSPTEAIVYGYLTGWLDVSKKGSFNPSQEDIAKAVGMSLPTTKRALKTLTEKGRLVVTRNGTKNTYRTKCQRYQNDTNERYQNDTIERYQNDTFKGIKMIPLEKENSPTPPKRNNITTYITTTSTDVEVPTEVLSAGRKKTAKRKKKYSEIDTKIHSKCKEIYSEIWLAEHGDKYYWDAQSMVGIVNIVKRVRSYMDEGERDDIEKVAYNFKAFVDMTFKHGDKWIKEHATPQIIASKFNEIYTSLKNGKTTNNGWKHISFGADILSEFT